MFGRVERQEWRLPPDMGGKTGNSVMEPPPWNSDTEKAVAYLLFDELHTNVKLESLSIASTRRGM
jgi:hypothetical protein